MASELTATCNFRYSKNGVELARNISAVVDISGNYINYAVQNIGTTEEALVLNDVTFGTAGYILVKNLDSTNYVTLGRLVTAVYQPFTKLKAGEVALFRLDQTSAPYAKANASACNLEYWLLVD